MWSSNTLNLKTIARNWSIGNGKEWKWELKRQRDLKKKQTVLHKVMYYILCHQMLEVILSLFLNGQTKAWKDHVIFWCTKRDQVEELEFESLSFWFQIPLTSENYTSKIHSLAKRIVRFFSQLILNKRSLDYI